MLLEMQHAFKIYDTDKNGTMDAREFKQVLVDLGKREVTDAQVKEMLSVVDRNNDNVIQWPEFLEVITKLISLNNKFRCSKGSKLLTKICFQVFSRLKQGKLNYYCSWRLI